MLSLCGFGICWGLRNLRDAEQDQDLENLEHTVLSTKHIALAVNEELDLHTRLLVRYGYLTDAYLSYIPYSSGSAVIFTSFYSVCLYILLPFLQDDMDKDADVTNNKLLVGSSSILSAVLRP